MNGEELSTSSGKEEGPVERFVRRSRVGVVKFRGRGSHRGDSGTEVGDGKMTLKVHLYNYRWYDKFFFF